MYDLIEYLNGGKCIVFVGSGPSCEVGLPSWAGLADTLLQEIRRRNPPDCDDYEVLAAQQKFPDLFGRAWRKLSPGFVIDVCTSALSDTLKRGVAYQFLADFNFQGYPEAQTWTIH